MSESSHKLFFRATPFSLRRVRNFYGIRNCHSLITKRPYVFSPLVRRYGFISFFTASFVYSFYKYYRQKHAVDRYKENLLKHGIPSDNLKFFLHYLFLPFGKILSFATLCLLDRHIPYITPVLNRILCSFIDINFSQCQRTSIDDYLTFTDIFTRSPVKPELVDSQRMISPCEGVVVSVGRLDPEETENFVMKDIKGADCHILDVLGFDENLLEKVNVKNCIFYAVLYLSPQNIHRFYSPIDFKQLSTTQIHGSNFVLGKNLYSKQFAQAICANHRVLVEAKTSFGKFLMVMVGTQNVSVIQMSKEEKKYVNSFDFTIKSKKNIDIEFKKGEEMGYFLLGSTIIMFFEAPRSFEFSIKPGDQLSLFQPIQN
ncbi:Phosphatidylserine decarboxylase proenzyme [Thelohanellus kitauei]|uniref:phosphatidylserine decarboxylase n=1 Tax=Thelohanellus kitauei TaxID=669202 RepID=A0A0C2J3Q4_THEKT|nr:Phosphatidylserine decarboxylase proenzyme [Thelohanellus kitauei]